MTEDEYDSLVSRVLGGEPTNDGVTLWLANSVRSDPPRALVDRIDALVTPASSPPRAFRYLALALAATLAFQAVGNVLAPDWLNENLGSTGTHALYELALALMAAAVAVGAGALVRAWRPVAVAAGGPLGVGLGLHGLTEIGVFAAGVALHTLEGVLAVAMIWAWWHERRYTRPGSREDGA